MRKIKFRAWDKTSRTFYFVSLSDNGWSHQDTDLEGHELSEWQQYTGLKDKNGMNIYEGDRLEYQPDIDEDFTKDRYTVKWHDRGFVAAWDGDKDCMNSDNDGLIGGPKLVDMVVIGNIYKNPEALKESR